MRGGRQREKMISPQTTITPFSLLRYNGRPLNETRVTTSWFDTKQAKEYGLPPPPPFPFVSKKGASWGRYSEEGASTAPHDGHSSTQHEPSDSNLYDSPGHQTPNSSGQGKRRASTPPRTVGKERRKSRVSPQPAQGSSKEQRWGRSRSPYASAKERHDSLDRPDSQLSSYSQSSWERDPTERKERGQQRERNESFPLSSRYAGRFGSRGSGEETESTHRRETGTRKRRASSPVASFKRSRENTHSEERKINIFDRLGPSSSHKEKLHSMETFGDIAFSTSPTSGKQLSESIGGDIGREEASLGEKYEGTLEFNAEYEHKSLSGESVGRRRGREILSVKEEFGENGSEERERGRERDRGRERERRRRHSYRDVERERTVRERGRENMWGREKEKEKEWYRSRQREREKTSKNEKDTDKIHSHAEPERERQRERGPDADIHWQPMETVDYEKETREERGEEESEENGGRKRLDGRRRKGEDNGMEDGNGGTPRIVRQREVREKDDTLEELEGEGEGESRRERLRSREEEEGEAERRDEERRRGREGEERQSQKGKESNRWVSPEFEGGGDTGDHTEHIAEMEPVLEGRERVVGEGEGIISPVSVPDPRDYSERDMTPPLEVLQSMQQSSYQEAFFPPHFPLRTTNDIAFHMFASSNQLTSFSSAPPPPLPISSMPFSPHYSHSSPLLAPAAPLGFPPHMPPGTGSGWGLPPGMTPVQWQLWIQNISQQSLPAEPATSISPATVTGETASAEQKLSSGLGSGVAELPTDSVDATPTQNEASPSRSELGLDVPGSGETEPLPASSLPSSPSPLPPSSRLPPPSPPPPAKKRRLDQQCRVDYRSMMQVWALNKVLYIS